MADLGSVNNFPTFGRHSHNWNDSMNANLIKAATLLHGAVSAVVSDLPGAPSANEAVINTSTGLIHVYAGGEWNTITPVFGTHLYSVAQDAYYIFNEDSEWEVLLELGTTYAAIERNLSFYAPGLVRPGGIVFRYIATMEFKIPAGAPHSYATLEVAPTGGNLVLNMNGGTITFNEGSTDGVFNVPSDVVILPADFETIYSTPQFLNISLATANNYAAEGLSVSIKGEIRSID